MTPDLGKIQTFLLCHRNKTLVIDCHWSNISCCFYMGHISPGHISLSLYNFQCHGNQFFPQTNHRRSEKILFTSPNALLPMGYFVQVVMWVFSDKTYLKGTKWTVFGGKRIHSMWYWKGSIVSASIRTPDPWVTKQTLYHWAIWLADEWA